MAKPERATVKHPHHFALDFGVLLPADPQPALVLGVMVASYATLKNTLLVYHARQRQLLVFNRPPGGELLLHAAPQRHN
jgi:hypothetical protein